MQFGVIFWLFSVRKKHNNSKCKPSLKDKVSSKFLPLKELESLKTWAGYFIPLVQLGHVLGNGSPSVILTMST